MSDMTRIMLFVLVLFSAIVGGCGGDGDQGNSTSDESRADSAARMSGGRDVPVALTDSIRREHGARTETLIAVPGTFILSYRCDAEGRKALVFSPYPPMASAIVWIDGNGRAVPPYDIAEGTAEGPYLNDRFQGAEVKQVTEARSSRLHVYVTFDEGGGCSVDDASVSAKREGHTSRFVMNRDPARPTVLSEDGTIALDLPEGWHATPESESTESLTVGSFPLPDPVTASCVPVAALARMPADGALIRVSEVVPGDGHDVSEMDFAARAHGQSFGLGKPKSSHECGAAYKVNFHQNGRKLIAWVWVHPRGWSYPADGVPGEPTRGGFNQRVRRDVTRVLDSLQVEIPRNAPVRIPFIALDCRNPPNTLGCDRVYARVSTRVPMRAMALRIGGRSIRLSRSPARDSGADRDLPRTVWTGYMTDAGLTRQGAPLEVGLPPDQLRWTGRPKVKATVAVSGSRDRGPGDTWTFYRVPLLAGHG